MKYLIVSADDFGYSKLFNKKILELINQGFVSSTSVMVDWVKQNQKEQVADLIGLYKNQNLSIGLHINFKNTIFLDEINRQFKKFMDLFGFGPSHLDIHKVRARSKITSSNSLRFMPNLFEKT